VLLKADSETNPIKNAVNPSALGKNKSLFSTLSGYPSVVIINILVDAKTAIKKLEADIVVTFRMILIIFSSDFVTSRLAKTAIENPQSKELVNMS